MLRFCSAGCVSDFAAVSAPSPKDWEYRDGERIGYDTLPGLMLRTPQHQTDAE